MIIRRNTSISNLHRFFVFEADNKQTIRVTPSKDATDYTQEVDATNDEPETEDNDDTEATDYTQEVDATNEEPETEDNDDSQNTDNNEGTDTDEEEPSDEGDTEEETTDDEGNGENTATDYTQEVDGNDGEQTSDKGQVPVEDPAVNEEDLEEAKKKYILYRDLMEVYYSNKSFISKLDDMTIDSIEGTLVVKKVIEKLKTIGDILFEFMVIKFDSTEYIECLSFFNSVIAGIKLSFELLQNNNVYLKH